MGTIPERMGGGRSAVKFTWDKLSFNSRQIKGKLTKSENSFFRHFGATVRMYARRSMRNKLKRVDSKTIEFADGRAYRTYPASEPGKPPFAHDKGLKDGIRFAWDTNAGSVVVGPPPSGEDIARFMEHGGTRKVRVFYEKSPTGKVLADFSKMRVESVTYPARPFMQPAFDANITPERLAFFFEGKGLDRAFKNSVIKKIQRFE